MISREEFFERVGFETRLSEECYRYLYEKETSGIQIRGPARTCIRFLRMCREEGYPLDYASKEAVERWNERTPNETPNNHYHRATAIRRFMKYLSTNGVEAYVDEDIRLGASTFSPYIFTREEISRIFDAADHLPYSPISPGRVPVIRLLIRALYGCGLRLSEALGLNMKDVDLVEGTLYIYHGKFGKDRITPISDSVKLRFDEYIRENCASRNADAPLFLTPQGTRYATGSIYYSWRQVLFLAGISHGGRGHGPRIHDLRHTFAVHRLQQWVESGSDLEVILPYLSAYMGHVGIASTQAYLHLRPELFPQITQAFEEKFNVFPEVSANL